MSPTVLPVRDQARVVNQILEQRFATLLPTVMRETGIDMWLIVCHEDNHDPVFRTMIPWQSWTPILQIIVLFDTGTEVERINISRTNMCGLMPPSPWNPLGEENQWGCLRRIVEALGHVGGCGDHARRKHESGRGRNADAPRARPHEDSYSWHAMHSDRSFNADRHYAHARRRCGG